MSWRIRHEGSPQSIDGLSLAQVIDGLYDGLWEPTDEVIGPGDHQWTAIENHPQLAEAALDVEPPLVPEPEDETRLDMNPLIDVALVLLIFFILTTTYAAIQKVLQAPDYSAADVSKPLLPTKEQVAKLMIKVRAVQEGTGPAFYVEDKRVADADLVPELRQYVTATRKTKLLIEADGITWGTLVRIQDAAKGAGIEEAFILRKPPTTKP